MQSWKVRLALMFAMMAMLIAVSVPAMAQEEEDFLGDVDIYCEDYDGDGLDDYDLVECEDPFLVVGLEDYFGSDYSDLDGDGYLDGLEIYCEDVDADGLDDDEFYECDDPVVVSE